MRRLISRYSHKILVLITSLFSIVATQIILRVGYHLYGIDIRISEEILCIIAPLSISSFVSWILFDVLKKLDCLEQQMRGLVNYDQLSDTLTKKAFIDHANDRMKIARRENREISLLMMDLDYFKQINDSYGHLAGDCVIKSVGQLLNRNKRAADLVGRFGGDEFIMLLWGTGVAVANEFANQLCDKVKTLNVLYDGNVINLSASIGLSGVYEGRHEEIAELISQADKALYLVKQSGRGRSVAFEK